jgi:hypothetical protein
MTRHDHDGRPADRSTRVESAGLVGCEPDTGKRLTRRRALAGAIGSGLVGLAGCTSGGDGDDSGPESGATDSYRASIEAVESTITTIEDPPKAVYVPSHRNGMTMRPAVRVGGFAVAPMITYPHRFWTVTGDQTEAVPVDRDHDIHLMVTVWDPDTGTVLPTDEGLRFEITQGSTLVDSRTPWSMLSQNMGFHFGDNVILDGDGTYEITIEVPPLSVRKTGALADRFGDGGSATVEFTFDQAFRDAVFEQTEYVAEESVGVRGAIEPSRGSMSGMDGGGEMLGPAPYSTLPTPASLPGRLLGEPKSGDADLVTTLVPADSRFAADPYLLVSARTPYNDVPLPALGLTAVHSRDGTALGEQTLTQTIDPEVGLHYGTPVPDARAGDTVDLRIDSPPQTARHQGYETAFLDMPTVSLSIPAVS